MRRLATLLLPLFCAICCLSIGCGDTIHNHYPPQPDPAPIVDPLPVPPKPQEKPFIDGPDAVEPGAPLWLTAEVEEGTVVEWYVAAPQGLAFKATERDYEFSTAAPLDATEVRVVMAVATYQGFGTGSLKVVEKTIQVGKAPNPPPGPDPPGPEPPKPANEPLRIVVVEESSDRTPEQGAIYFDKALRDYVTSKGHTFAVWDVTNAATGEHAAENQAILDRAKGKPLPYLQVIGKTSGTVYSEGGLPKGDAAAMLKFIQGWEGR